MAQRMLDDEALLAIAKKSGGSGGTNNYNELNNKPEINDVTLSGNKSSSDLGLQADVGLSLTPTAVVSDRDIQDGQGNTLSVLAEALTKTASGNPVVITDCAGGKARSLITEINAIQDLHGYDKPWVGGAGKNIYVGSPSFDGYVNPRDTWVKQAETYNGHEVYKKSGEAWSGMYKRFYLPAGTYTFSVAVKTSGDGDGVAIFTVLNTDEERAAGSDLNKNTTATDSWTVISNTFTITTAGYVCPRIEKTEGTGDIYISEYQLEVGSTVTSYAPYSNICPISGRTAAVITRSDGDEISEDFTIQLGQTVYGADINWDTGVATVTHKRIAPSAVLSGFMGRSNYIGIVATDATPCTSAQLSNAISDRFVAITGDAQYTQDLSGIAQSLANPTDTSSRVLITVSGITSVADLNTWLAENTPQICYELANPTSIQLTPTEVQMLKGYNRVTIDNGTITLDYVDKTDSIQVEVDALDANKAEKTTIAPVENGTKASQVYAIGKHFVRDNKFCTAIAAISSGATLTKNTNYVEGTIADNLPKQVDFDLMTNERGNATLTTDLSRTIIAVKATDYYICTLYRAPEGTGIHVTDTNWNLVASRAVSGTYYYI